MRAKLSSLSQARQLRTWYDLDGRKWRDLDETSPLVAAPEASAWLALIVAPRMEEAAADALRDAGYIAWYPQTVETVTRQWRRVRVKVNRPLFPRYVFAAAAEPTGGVSKVVGMGGSGRTTKGAHGPSMGMLDCDHVVRIVGAVGPGLMADLSRRQAGGEFVTELRQSLYRRGARVRIIDGPFQGLDGIVHRGEAERIDVLVGMLGQQVSVRIDTDQVRAAWYALGMHTLADAIAADKTHLEMQCPCAVKWIPLGHLPRCPAATALVDIAARYRCQRCGERPVLVRAINPQTDIEKGGM